MSVDTQLCKLRTINGQVEKFASAETTLFHLGFLAMVMPYIPEDQRETIMEASFLVRDAHYDQGMEETAELVEMIAAQTSGERARALNVAGKAIRSLIAKNRADRAEDHPNG